MLNTALYLIRPEGCRELLNKLDHKTRPSVLARDLSRETSDLELTRYPTVLLSPLIEKANIFKEDEIPMISNFNNINKD